MSQNVCRRCRILYIRPSRLKIKRELTRAYAHAFLSHVRVSRPTDSTKKGSATWFFLCFVLSRVSRSGGRDSTKKAAHACTLSHARTKYKEHQLQHRQLQKSLCDLLAAGCRCLRIVKYPFNFGLNLNVNITVLYYR